MSKRKRIIEDLGDTELDPVLDDLVRKKTAEADADLDATRVNFRWGKQQLELVKYVAEQTGIPYQTYIKHVVFQQALTDLQSITKTGYQGGATLKSRSKIKSGSLNYESNV